MQIDWTRFTPLASFDGGLMIGVAAGLFVLVLGRIAGISGILGGLLRPQHGDVDWRIAFIAGLALSAPIYALFAASATIEVSASYPVVAIAGVLVGIGTRYGGGCTSGHGVCGISRRSGRSLTATITFMAAGFIVVYVTRHVLGSFS